MQRVATLAGWVIAAALAIILLDFVVRLPDDDLAASRGREALVGKKVVQRAHRCRTILDEDILVPVVPYGARQDDHLSVILPDILQGDRFIRRDDPRRHPSGDHGSDL